MNDEKDKLEIPKKSKTSGGQWVVIIALIALVLFCIGRNMEVHSDAGRANFQQMQGNMIQNTYNEVAESCASDMTPEQCKDLAEQAAEMARRKLNYGR